MADYTKQISLIMEVRARVGRGLRDFRQLADSLNRIVDPLNKKLSTLQKNVNNVSALYRELSKFSQLQGQLGPLTKELEQISAILSKLTFDKAIRGYNNLTKTLLNANKQLREHTRLLRQMSKSKIGARTDVGEIGLAKSFKTETDEFVRILRTLEPQIRSTFARSFQAARGELKTFEQQVAFARNLIYKHFQQMFPKEVFVKAAPFMKRFTGALDESATKVSIAKTKFESFKETGEHLNTIIHELAEAMLFQTGTFDKSSEASVRAAHEQAKLIAELIMLNTFAGQSSASINRMSASLEKVNSTSQLALANVRSLGGAFQQLGAPTGGAGGINAVEDLLGMWGRLGDTIRKTQSEARLFGNEVQVVQRTLGVMRSEIETLAGEMAIAFVPTLVESQSKGLTNLAIRIKQIREDTKGLVEVNSRLRENIRTFEHIDRSVEGADERIKKLSASIQRDLVRALGPQVFKQFRREMKGTLTDLELFQAAFLKIGQQAGKTGALASTLERLRTQLQAVTTEALHLANESNTMSSNIDQTNESVLRSVPIFERYAQAHGHILEITNKEIAEQQKLRTEYEALMVMLGRVGKGAELAGTQFANQENVLKRLMSLLERRNKIVEQGVVTDNQFLEAESRIILAMNREAQTAQLDATQQEKLIETRRRGVQEILNQVEAQRQLIQSMHGRPTRFEFEETLKSLQKTMRQTEEEMLKIRQAMLRVGQGTPQFKKLEIAMNELQTSARFTEKQIEQLSIRLRQDVPRSADAARAASRLTATGFIAMLKSQAAWMAGFAVVFGTIYKFQEALRSTVDIMNETARVMRTMRSETLTTGEQVVAVSQAIRESLRTWAEETRVAAQALYELGSAGLSLEQSLNALKPVMDLVVGGEAEVSQTARVLSGVFINLTSSIVNAEGELISMGGVATELQGHLADATKSGREFAAIADVMTAAVRDHLIEIDELNQGLKFIIAPARIAGLSFEEMTGILAVLGDNMIRAGMAGRSMRTILSRMSKEADLFSQAFGVAIDTTKPLDFMDVLRQLNEQMGEGRLSAEELGKIFTRLGLRGAPAFIKLVENFNAVTEAVSSLENSAAGAAEKMAEIQLDKPAKQLALMRENILALVRDALDPLIGIVIKMIRVFNDVAGILETVNDALGGIPAGFFRVIAPALALVTVFGAMRRIMKTQFVVDLTTRFKRMGEEIDFAGVQMSKAQKVFFNLTRTMGDEAKVAEALGNKQLQAAAAVRKWTDAAHKGQQVTLSWAVGGKKVTQTLQQFQQTARAAGTTTQALAQEIGIANIAVQRHGQAALRAAAATNVATGATLTFKSALLSLWVVIKSNPILILIGVISGLILLIQKMVGWLKTDYKQMQDNIDKMNEEVDAQERRVNAVKKYIDIVSQSISKEKALEQIRAEGLHEMEGLVTLTNSRGNAVLMTVEALEKELRVQEALLQVERERAADEAFKDLPKITKNIEQLTLKFDALTDTTIDARTDFEKYVDLFKEGSLGYQLFAKIFGENTKDVVELSKELRQKLAKDFKIAEEQLKALRLAYGQDFEGMTESGRQMARDLEKVFQGAKNILEKNTPEVKSDRILPARELNLLIDSLDEIRTAVFKTSQDYIDNISRMEEESKARLEKLRGHMRAVVADNERNAKNFEKEMKNLSDLVQAPIDVVETAFRGLSTESTKQIREMIKNFDQAVREMQTARGLDFNEAFKIQVDKIRDRLFNAFREAFDQLSRIDFDFELINDRSMTRIMSSFLGFMDVTENIQKAWEDFTLDKAQNEIDKLIDNADRSFEEWNSKWEFGLKIIDEKNAIDAIKGIESQLGPLNSALQKTVQSATEFTKEIQKQSIAIEDVDLKIAGFGSKVSSVAEEIRQTYASAGSAAENLGSKVVTIAKRQQHLNRLSRQYRDQHIKSARDIQSVYDIAYTEIGKLENELQRGRAKSIKDLDSDWKGLVRAQIDGEKQLAKVREARIRAEAETTKDAQKIKDLKNEERDIEEQIFDVSRRRIQVTIARRQEAEKQIGNLRTQFEFSIQQFKVSSELADKYGEIARDEKRTISEREDAAKRAEKFANQSIEAAKNAAKVDTKRVEVAGILGRKYFDHQKTIEGFVRTGLDKTLDNLQDQKKIAEDRVKIAETQRDKEIKNAEDLKSRIDKLQVAHVLVKKQIQSILSLTGAELPASYDALFAKVAAIEDPTKRILQAIKDMPSELKKATGEMSDFADEAERASEALAGSAIVPFGPREHSGGVPHRVMGVRGWSGTKVPVRVTAGEGLFTPDVVQKHYSKLAQINSGRRTNFGVRPAGIFQGSPGVDTIRTAVPEGSYIMSHRGMDAMRASDTNQGYQGGGIVEPQAQDDFPVAQEPEDLGTLTLKIVTDDGEIDVPVVDTRENLKKIDRELRRNRLQRIK